MSKNSATRTRKSGTSAKDKRPPAPRLWPRIIKSTFSLMILLIIGGFIGTWWVQHSVIQRIKGRDAVSSSAIVSRPFVIHVQSPFGLKQFIERLYRLRYDNITKDNETETPKLPGTFLQSANSILVYLRECQLPSGETTQPQLVEVQFANGRVHSIRNVKYNTALDKVILEPEIISVLDTSERRAVTPKKLNEFPPLLIKAISAIEDERFYYHFGLDIIAIARAVVTNIQSGEIVQGGSTITQQLAKNLFFSNERTLYRKALEAITAILIEAGFTKNQILELYLNEVFLGQEGVVAIHGFGEAAFSFYGKSVSELSLSETATLVGLIQAPSAYSPRRNPKKALKRRNIVLTKLVEQGVITQGELTTAQKTPISVQPMRHAQRTAPYFSSFVRKELDNYETYWSKAEDTFVIHTDLDVSYQECAEQAVKNGISRIRKDYPRLAKKGDNLQASLISLAVSDGGVRAWVGGVDYATSQFCRISMSARQPGSAFKPIVYLTALDKNLNQYRVARPTSLLPDEPLTVEIQGVGEWSPENYDHQHRGEVTVRQALEHSLNIPTVHLALKVGIPAIQHTAKVLGITQPLPSVASLALGAVEVTPMELATAYRTIAAGGEYIPVRAIRSITSNAFSAPFYQMPFEPENVCSEDAAFVLTNLLQGVINSGTGNIIRQRGFEGPAAGKTGTSNDTRDAWFAGYTPSLLAVVWVGLDDNSQLGLTGGQAAAPIWAEYMKCVAPHEPEIEFLPPAGVVTKDIDKITGLLWRPECGYENRITEVFVAGNEPITMCDTQSDTDDTPIIDIQDLPQDTEQLPPTRKPTSQDIRRKKWLVEKLFDVFD